MSVRQSIDTDVSIADPPIAWTRRSIVVTLRGPTGKQVFTINKPFARVGTHPRCEVVLPDGPAKRLFLHSSDAGIYCLSLEAPAGGKPPFNGWMAPRRAIAVGAYLLTARFADDATEVNAGISPESTDAAPAASPQLELTTVTGRRQTVQLRLRRPLTIVGREPPSKLCLADSSISRAHCILYWDDARLWAIDLFSVNGIRIDNRPVDFGVMQPGSGLVLGNIRLTHLSDSAAAPTQRNDIEPELTLASAPEPATPSAAPGSDTKVMPAFRSASGNQEPVGTATGGSSISDGGAMLAEPVERNGNDVPRAALTAAAISSREHQGLVERIARLEEELALAKSQHKKDEPDSLVDEGSSAADRGALEATVDELRREAQQQAEAWNERREALLAELAGVRSELVAAIQERDSTLLELQHAQSRQPPESQEVEADSRQQEAEFARQQELEARGELSARLMHIEQSHHALEETHTSLATSHGLLKADFHGLELARRALQVQLTASLDLTEQQRKTIEELTAQREAEQAATSELLALHGADARYADGELPLEELAELEFASNDPTADEMVLEDVLISDVLVDETVGDEVELDESAEDEADLVDAENGDLENDDVENDDVIISDAEFDEVDLEDAFQDESAESDAVVLESPDYEAAELDASEYESDESGSNVTTDEEPVWSASEDDERPGDEVGDQLEDEVDDPATLDAQFLGAIAPAPIARRQPGDGFPPTMLPASELSTKRSNRKRSTIKTIAPGDDELFDQLVSAQSKKAKVSGRRRMLATVGIGSVVTLALAAAIYFAWQPIMQVLGL